MSYEIVCGSFSGPMEVLLDLIKKREMDIYDIQIHVLVEDFLHYVGEMDAPSLDAIADFLAMASYLLAIKSRMLLPKPQTSESEEEDPRAGLVERLVEYERMKAVSLLLEEMAEYEDGAIYKKQEDFSSSSGKNLLSAGSIDQLSNAFQEVLRRYEVHESAKRALEKIPLEKFSYKDAEEKICAAFKEWDSPHFFDVVRDAQSRVEIVTIFLTILELIKLQKIDCRQEGKDNVLINKGIVYEFES